MVDQIWRLQIGHGPLVATAIHDGHELREELRDHMSLRDAERLREEDPFTGGWTKLAPTRIVGLRSRFEVDLNRPREKAVYRVPEDAWGLQVWKGSLPSDAADRSLSEYDAFYRALGDLYGELADQHGKFVVYDLHTYNHRRAGEAGPLADPTSNPQVNIGTGTMNRARWAPVIDSLIDSLGSFDYPNGKLDVRENVKFLGGNHARWAHETFPEAACVIAVEFKKFFMDEWSGEPDQVQLDAIGAALQSTVPVVLDALQRV